MVVVMLLELHKIQNGIIKTAVSSKRRDFLDFIQVYRILFLVCLRNVIRKQRGMPVLVTFLYALWLSLKSAISHTAEN